MADKTDEFGKSNESVKSDEVEPVLVLLSFISEHTDKLIEVLAKYVVLSRGHPGCRNIDFVASITNPERVVLVQKWDSSRSQQLHFDSDEMVSMARQAVPLLKAEPDIDVFEGISMHDLA